MEQIDSTLVKCAIQHAPDWVREGLTAPTEAIREQAAAELAQAVLDALQGSQTAFDPRQIALPL